MRTWDFYLQDASSTAEAASVWGPTVSSPAIDTDLLDAILRGPLSTHDDVEVAVPLARVTHDEFEAYGTNGSGLSNDDSRTLLRTLTAVLTRLGIDSFDPPFRDFDTFRRYWKANDGHGSWQARRDMLEKLFEEVHTRLAARETDALSAVLANPVSPKGATGWRRVDEELNEMRRHFQSARTEQDYSNVGNDAVAALEALSAAAYDHAKHGTPGSDEPPVANTKDRFDSIITTELVGSEHAELRALARAAVKLAQATKHRRTGGDRRSAGMTADAVILVVNLLRRLREPA